ncbi:endospore germination permease [Peptococcaceae bacterium 1198_IL3148]
MSRSMDVFTLDPGKISARQLLFIIITVIISTADVFLPAIVAAIAGRDAWISIIIATAEALVVAAVALALANRFPQKNLIQIIQIVLGKWLGWVTAFVFLFFYFVVLTGNSVAQISVIMKVAFMGSTPLSVFVILMILIAAYAVNQGIEVIARVTELLLPLGIGLLFLVGFLLIPRLEMENYFPIMTEGIGPIFNGATRLLSFLAEAIIILMLAPYLNEPKRLGSTLIWSILLLGGFMFIGVLAIGVFGVQQTSIMTFPALEMVRRIEIGQYFEHLDAIIVTIWVSGIYLKVVVLYYISCIGLAQLTGCQSYRSLVIPLGVFVSALSLSWTYDINSLINVITNSWPSEALLFQFLIPLILLVIAAVRGLKDEREQ